MLKQEKLDPLYIIFEKHLLDFEDEKLDKKSFAVGVTQEYLRFLNKQNVTVPEHFQNHVIEELEIQVSTMLVKKMYGCLNIREFQEKSDQKTRVRARSRYKKLKTG